MRRGAGGAERGGKERKGGGKGGHLSGLVALRHSARISRLSARKALLCTPSGEVARKTSAAWS